MNGFVLTGSGFGEEDGCCTDRSAEDEYGRRLLDAWWRLVGNERKICKHKWDNNVNLLP